MSIFKGYVFVQYIFVSWITQKVTNRLWQNFTEGSGKQKVVLFCWRYEFFCGFRIL